MRHWAIGLIVGATLLVVACGQENPSATSSDDTHSIGKTTEQTGSGQSNSSEPTELVTSSNNDGVSSGHSVVEDSVSEGSAVTLSSNPSMTVAAEVSPSGASTTLAQSTVAITTNPKVAPTTTSRTQTTSPKMTTTTKPQNTPTTTIPRISPTSTIAQPIRPAPTIALGCDAMPLANCQNVDLRGRDLYYANFQGANLAGANLSGMDLTGADFTDANLTGTNLIGATLDYCYFFNTNLTSAKLTRVSMNGIVWDDTTIWPTGFVPPDY